MATAVQQRRGTTSEHSSFGGLEGEITVDTELKTVIVHDGSGNAGSGTRLAKYSEIEASDTLAELNDVNLTSPSDGSFLQYDNASSKWIDTQTIVQHTDGIKIEGTSAGSSLFGSSDFGLAVDNNSGVGAIQVSGSTLAYIDLQTPEGDTSDVFDVRLISGNASNGTYPNAQLIAKGQNLDIKTTTSGDVTLQRQGSVKLSTSANGIDVTGTVTADAFTASQTISNYVTDTAIDVTEFASYAGKKIIYTGAASTISLPNVVAADIGKSWTIINAGTGVITVDVDASGTAQQVRHAHAGGVNTSTTDRTIAIGGVVEIICIAEDSSGITNSSDKPNYLIYGGGVI